MTKLWIACAGIVALLVASASPVLAEGDAAAGKAVYGKRCATCHGDKGEGKPTVAKMMKVEFRHLGGKEVQELTDEKMTEVVTKGLNKMKPVQGLTPADVTNVIAFVRTLKSS
jgi:mono/diheme cytochrome c family protein